MYAARSHALVKGAVAGAVGGIVGTFAMNHAQRWWTRIVAKTPPQSAAGKHDARDWQERSEGRNANEIAVQTLAPAVVGRPLTRQELAVGAAGLHYAFGATVAAVYGAYRESHHYKRRSSGLGFGTAVWLIADEFVMPLVKLSQPSTRRPIEMHLQAFTAHLVFGAVSERARVWTRRAL